MSKHLLLTRVQEKREKSFWWCQAVSCHVRRSGMESKPHRVQRTYEVEGGFYCEMSDDWLGGRGVTHDTRGVRRGLAKRAISTPHSSSMCAADTFSPGECCSQCILYGILLYLSGFTALLVCTAFFFFLFASWRALPWSGAQIVSRDPGLTTLLQCLHLSIFLNCVMMKNGG